MAGEEEVRKLIDHMVDHKEIAKSLKQVSDNGRLDVIRCLGLYYIVFSVFCMFFVSLFLDLWNILKISLVTLLEQKDK